MMKKILFVLALFCLIPYAVHARDLEARQGIFKARIISVEKTEKVFSPITQTDEDIQLLTARVTSGNELGNTISVENDYTPLEVGDTFFAQRRIDFDTGSIVYAVAEPNRLPSLIFFTCLFLVILFAFGGMQGVRGLISLIISLVLIIFILIPGMLKGYSPIVVSLLVSSVIIVLGSYITHGFNRTTTAAVCGMIGSVVVTGILAYIAVETTHLSGFASEESVYLRSITGGLFNVQGLLLSGILIGLLGVLYDAAISQAIAIEELLRANRTMTVAELYTRGIRIGREHIGALVDTLAIAYVGASLPLLLLVAHSGGEPLYYTINHEIFATEIIRTLVGSIGLILAVPLTTYISVFVLKNSKRLEGKSEHSHHHHT